MSTTTEGMAVTTTQPLSNTTAKKVDQKNLVTGEDFRVKLGDVAKASLDKAADNGGPRNQVGQFPLSGKQTAAPAPESFLGAEGSDQN